MNTGMERNFSPAFRKALATRGHALPNGSFPIRNAADLKNAISALGRAKDPAAAKAHIIARAKTLKLTSLLPADWKVSTAAESVFHATDVLPATEAIFTAEEGKAPTEAEITIVRPGESLNLRNYTKGAIKRAVEAGFWNGSRMFVDHGDPKMPMKRSLTSLVSVIKDTHLGPAGEAVGTVKFIRPEFAQFAFDAHESAPDAMGVSIVHEFKGRRYKGPDGKVHEEVDDFVVNHSVDWVAFPAAGGGITQFLPATESEEDVDWETLTAEMLQEHAPAVFDSIVETARESAMSGNESENGEGTPNDAGAATLTPEDIRKLVSESVADERKVWQEEQDRKADAAAKTAQLVGKSGLPERTRSRLVAQFAGNAEFVEATVQEAIDDAKAELKEAGVTGPVVRGLGASGTSGEGATLDAATLAEQAPAMVAFEAAMGYTREPASTADKSKGATN